MNMTFLGLTAVRMAAALSLLIGILQPANAQTPPRIGVLSPGQSRFPPIDAFERTLQEKGWVLGKTITIDYRFSAGRADVDAKNAAELSARRIDVLVAWGPSPALAAKELADRVPVVFIGVNGPVERGLVKSLAHPGGNITGITFEAGEGLFPKQLQLLADCVPGLARVAFLTVAWEPVRPSVRTGLAAAAKTLGVTLSEFQLRAPQDLDAAVADAKRRGAQALFVLPTAYASAYRWKIAAAASGHRLPSMHGMSEAATAGALMSYAPSLSDVARQGALYVDRILRGAQPASLPVQEPTRFELVINMRVAKALGLSIPPDVRLRADRIIE